MCIGEIRMSSDQLRVIVIGLDGATFDLVKPWAEQGHLPTFRRLMEEGSWGELQSTLPPMTGPAWSSFITGKNPGKHGIFDFMVRNPEGYDWITINATFRKGRSFWSFLEEDGKKLVIFNVPVTYPPEPVKGAMVSGFLTPPGAKDFIFPSELQEKLEREVGPFRPHYPGEIYSLGREEKFVQEIEQMTEGTIKTMRFLMEKEPWDVFVGVIQSPDLLQHCLWKFEDRRHPLYRENRRVAGAFLKNYQLIDRYLGEVLEGLDERTLLFVISDHGFNYIEKQFFVNNWLLEEGFLSLKRNFRTFVKKALFKMGIVPMKIHKISASLGIDLSKPLAKNREKLFTGLNQWVLSFEDVDWKRSRAYAMGNMGFINVNLKGREPQGMIEPGRDYEKVVDEISERLSLLKDPQTGAPLVSRILRNKDICWGPWASSGPDLFLVIKEYAYYPRGDYIFVSNHVVDDLWLVSGSHRDHGIFLSWGPGIRKGYKMTGANIMDVAPTLLGLLGGRIPVDMDGRCLMEILTEERRQGISLEYIAAVSESSPEASLSEKEQEDLRRQLKGLGYLT
jgi:predicted AlkP superfamily phosphohydrolase/phosphomutase